MAAGLNNTNVSRAEYLVHIERQLNSDLSIRQYCDQNNLIGHRFSYYKSYKLRTKKTEVKKLKSFAKVEIKTKNHQSPAILPPAGINHVSVDPAWLAKFISTLIKLT